MRLDALWKSWILKRSLSCLSCVLRSWGDSCGQLPPWAPWFVWRGLNTGFRFLAKPPSPSAAFRLARRLPSSGSDLGRHGSTLTEYWKLQIWRKASGLWQLPLQQGVQSPALGALNQLRPRVSAAGFPPLTAGLRPGRPGCPGKVSVWQERAHLSFQSWAFLTEGSTRDRRNHV